MYTVREMGRDICYRNDPELIDQFLNPEMIPKVTGLSA
jgi:hypothetical protein